MDAKACRVIKLVRKERDWEDQNFVGVLKDLALFYSIIPRGGI